MPAEFKQNRTREKPQIEQNKTSQKSYIVENAVDVIKNSDSRAQVSRQKTEDKLTAQRYVNKADYGTGPSYLIKVKHEAEEEKKLIQEILDNENNEKESNRTNNELSVEEKNELLRALKTKWSVVNKKFQSILSAQTLIKLNEKEKLEKALKDIEKDIDVISKPRIVVEQQ